MSKVYIAREDNLTDGMMLGTDFDTEELCFLSECLKDGYCIVVDYK